MTFSRATVIRDQDQGPERAVLKGTIAQRKSSEPIQQVLREGTAKPCALALTSKRITTA